MWTWSLNWGYITPEILIGTCPMTPNDIERVHTETGISGVLSLQHDECLSYWHIDYDNLYKTANQLNIRIMRCPIRDFDVPDMRRMLPNAVSSLAALINDERKTYVHCTAGLGRAPLTVLAYLIWIENLSPEKAIKLILKGRPGAVPAWEALQGAKLDMVRLYWSEIEERAYHIYQLGTNNDSVSDWSQAENEIIRSALQNSIISK
jgi:atypical dual specificity phosphatase